MVRTATEMLVESVRIDSPDTKTFRLKWPEGYDVEFKTGQFITLYWSDWPNHKRAYSLSSTALERGYFDITVKREGKMGTRVADCARPGERLMVLPPAGNFLPVLSPDHHLICIAGGAGLTPYRAFVREATFRKAKTRITILHSVRTPRNLLFSNELREMERENPRFRFHVTCTRAHDDGSWPGLRGRIDAELLKLPVRHLPATLFYACGPNALVEAAEKIVVREFHFPKSQFRSEKWGLG